MSPDPAGIVLLLAGLGLVVQGIRLARRWRIGQAAAVDWAGGLRRLPRAYLHTVHDVVARDPYASRMHVLVAGGLVAAILLSVVRHVFGWGGAALAVAIVAAGAISLAGAGMVAWRRRPPRMRRLSGGRYDALAFVLAGALLFLLLSALLAIRPAGSAAWGAAVLLGVLSLGTLLAWVTDGPMRHAAAGIVHLVAHRRPERFAGRFAAALRPLDLVPDAPLPRLGAGRAADFGWPALAQFDACVQCGRCQDVCPARAAGQPLNPKQLIQDLVRAGQTDAAGHLPLVVDAQGRGAIDPESLWACTTCRACVHECPMLIEHVDAIIDMRRHQTLEAAAVPAQSAAALGELRATDTVAGRPLDARLDWAADLLLPILAEHGETDVLLWLGEGAFDRRNQRTLRALVVLLRRAGVAFAVLGAEERDCGDLARRLGDEITFQDLARRNIATLAKYRFRRILTADPHVLQVLRHEYPAFGGHYDVVHHAAFLDELLAEGRLAVRTPAGAVTLHDPCYLARYSGEVAPPRRLLARLGAELVEMERHGLRAQCCGGGGGAALSDIPGKRRVPDVRMDQARATGAPVLAVACPTCANMLEGVSGTRPEVADLAELVLLATGDAT